MTSSDSGRKLGGLRGRARDEARFFSGWLRRPLVTGAVSPSSRALGRAMAARLPLAAILAGDMAVLELGPGTGVVTRCLIERGLPEASLVLVEYSQEFSALLRVRFPQACILQGDAYRPLPGLEAALCGRPVGAVVSSLPLFARPEAEREAVVAAALGGMPQGHPFIQFSYGLTAPVKPARIGAHLETGPWVKLNLPPARALVYQRPAGTA